MEIPRYSHGLKGFVGDGGECTLRNFGTSIGRGAKNLNSQQMRSYQKAGLLVMVENGSRWEDAKKTLEEAGFEVLFV